MVATAQAVALGDGLPSITALAANWAWQQVAVCTGTPDITLYQGPAPSTPPPPTAATTAAAASPASAVPLGPATSDVSTCSDGDAWVQVGQLSRHEQRVTDLDWGSGAHPLVSCSVDRNAFVWRHNGTAWEHQMVITRLDRAALCVRWDPAGKKFAIGSGSKTVTICYFDGDNQWWACKQIRKAHNSSVVTLAWHPRGHLLATGSTDFKCRIFRAFVEGVDKKNEGESFQPAFGTLLCELQPSSAWVHSVSWSPSGKTLAFCTHDAKVHMVQLLDMDDSSFANAQVSQSLWLPCLPFKTVEFLRDDLVIGGGWDGIAYMVIMTVLGQWDVKRIKGFEAGIDLNSDVDALPLPPRAQSNIAIKMRMLKLQAQGPSQEVEQKETGGPDQAFNMISHRDCITHLSGIEGEARDKPSFISAALDGKLICWELSA